MLDLGPAAEEMARLTGHLRDDQLDDPTPCPDYTLGDLVDHVNGLALAFTMAARKEALPGGSQGPSGDASRLDPGWRDELTGRLTELAQAWRDPAARQGMTQAGGIDLPGEVAGVVALDELVLHGWDIAVASRQRLRADDASVAVCLEFVAASVTEEPGPDDLFGPPVPVAEDAAPLDRLVGLAGRDPGWRAS